MEILNGNGVPIKYKSGTQTTNEQLYHYHTQIDQWMRNDSVFLHFMRSKINDFYNANGIRIDQITKRRVEITKKYYQYDAEKNIPLRDAEGKFTLIEGASEEEYMKEISEYMMTKITITL